MKSPRIGATVFFEQRTARFYYRTIHVVPIFILSDISR
jgi:hypothetical protein